MTDDRQADYRELLRSPYDPDPEERREGESDLPWIPAVVAAVAGALAVGAFVVYSIATAPDVEETVATSDPTVESTTTTLAPVASDELPPGFTALGDDVGVRVESVVGDEGATVLALSTAVRGGEDPGEVRPPDVAFWELRVAGVPMPMTTQYGERGALGNITVEFAEAGTLAEPVLLAHLAEGVDEQTVTLDVPFDGLPTTLDHRIDLGDGGVVVIDELTIGDGWGYVAWHAEGESPAIVDVIVTFVGTDDPGSPDLVDPTLLTSPHLRVIGQGTGSRPLGSMFTFSSSSQLVRSGEPLSVSNVPEAITVEFIVRTPESIAEPIEVPVPTA